jgi:hypothetical protein
MGRPFAAFVMLGATRRPVTYFFTGGASPGAMYAPIDRKIGSAALGSTPCALKAEGSKVAAMAMAILREGR